MNPLNLKNHVFLQFTEMSLYCFSIIPPSVPFSPSRTSITPTPGLPDKSSPFLTRSFIISISLYYCSGLWGISSLWPSKPLISTLLLIFEFKNRVFLAPESVWHTSISSRCKILPCEFKFLSGLSIHPASKKRPLQVRSLAPSFLWWSPWNRVVICLCLLEDTAYPLFMQQ